MHTFHTYAEYEMSGHPRPCRFVCRQCRQTIELPEIPGGCGASGYGLTGQRPALQMICYPCCTANDKASMLDRSGPFTAYLSSDGMRVTNWTGATLGDVIRESKSRNGFHGSTIHYVRCRDVHGSLWSGRGPGRGMYLTLRPMKGD